MLHRFRNRDRNVEGHDPAVLMKVLSSLRREGYQLLAISELIRRLTGEGAPLRRAVAFTLDDGYEDQATVAAPLFASFDCPATIFVTTGFLDGDIWLWWDQLEYIIRKTDRDKVQIHPDGVPVEHVLSNLAEKEYAYQDLTARCKTRSSPQCQRLITLLAEAAGVELPSQPPPQYQPMSWDQVRASERMGLEFGAHSVTHPVLTRTSDEQCRREIECSWQRLKAEAATPVPVFAYPNGTKGDYGPREIQLLREVGFSGALTAMPGYAKRLTAADKDNKSLFILPRFSYPDDLAQTLSYAAGIERLRQLARRAAPAI